MTTTYARPTLTDLGAVEDLTQVVISIKVSVPGTDIHINKSGVKAVSGGDAGLTIDTEGVS
jgi:hypothetical protein